MRVLRIYHSGRDRDHRYRARALVGLGVEVTLVVPRRWPVPGAEDTLTPEPFDVVELDVQRPGDVNRYRFAEPDALRRLVAAVRPDILDVHEEPVSLAARQALAAAPPDLPVVMYTAQNIDKRYPPPFDRYERAALDRVNALYPCSRQAAAVARGKGFRGRIAVIPLGVSDRLYAPGEQAATDEEIQLVLLGRFVPEKGLDDAVDVLAGLAADRPARLVLMGSGPALDAALGRAERLGVRELVDVRPWAPAEEVAGLYRRSHVVLVPSTATRTWVEQFGRVIVEAQASGAVVVGYASGSIPEVGGTAAVLVPEGDRPALVAAVRSLLADPAEFARRRAEGIEAVASFTWSAVTARLHDLYRDVLAQPASTVTGPVGSPRERRVAAVREFGEPARIPGPERPFALPVLRDHDTLARGLGTVIDAAVEAGHRARAASGRRSTRR